MGQFNCDFDSKKLKGKIRSVESVFLGKKCYVDKSTFEFARKAGVRMLVVSDNSTGGYNMTSYASQLDSNLTYLYTSDIMH